MRAGRTLPDAGRKAERIEATLALFDPAALSSTENPAESEGRNGPAR